VNLSKFVVPILFVTYFGKNEELREESPNPWKKIDFE
jgi:hypothetical protein